MNVNSSQSHEAQFGPPSPLINVSQFVRGAVQLENGSPDQASCKLFSQSSNSLNAKAREDWQKIDQARHEAIEAECSVGDVQAALNEIITTPRLYSHVTKTQQALVQSIYETAEASNRRKRKRVTVTEPAEEHPSITALRTKLDAVQLRSWPLTLNSALFIRTPRNADHNTLIETKQFKLHPGTQDPNQAVIFVTIHSPLSWGHKLLARSSQHVVLSSQTIGDLFDVIPCHSNEIPLETRNDDTISIWTPVNATSGSTGAVICIEGIVYGDGQNGKDYSDQLLETIQSLTEKKRPPLTKGAPMYETKFNSLSLRLHTPYWLMHAGNCEHFFVIDDIRLLHTSDPPVTAYPLTTQITPLLSDNCRICNKVPAVYSILGDMRLGESPFVACSPCWKWMGMPKGEAASEVTVVPLSKHEFGWNA